MPRKLGLIFIGLVVAATSSSAHAAPTMTHASIVFPGFITWDGHLTTTSQQRAWTAYEQGTNASPAVIVQGARTIVEPVQFVLSGYGTESISGGSGSVWSLTAGSLCFCLVDLSCPPPPGPPCGTYTRTGSQLTVTINNVFVTGGPAPIAQTTGPYNGLVFKGRVVYMHEAPSGTVGELPGSLTYR